MKKLLYGVLLCFALSACGAAPEPLMGQTSPRAVQAVAVTMVTPPAMGTPTPNQLQTAMAVIAIDGATSTAASAATGTSYVVTSTYQAQETQAFWVGVTLGVATERGLETQVAKTETAGTHQANGLTQQSPSQTALAATQAVEMNDLHATVTRSWILNVGGTLALVGFLWLLILGGFDARRYLNEKGSAKNLQEKTSALQATPNGFPLVPSHSLKPGEKLVNMNLAHRAVVDPAEADDLTSEQALANTNAQRKLDGIRSVANSPAVGSLLKRIIMKEEQDAAKKPMGDVTITKPDQPLLAVLPELPIPHWKMLNRWDGQLLPFGMDEKAELMRVDTSSRPHFMVVGRSRSGKTLSSIRPMVACLLTMGWNVIVMGKRVDFMPFEEHPNFKLVAVDVRKDAQKYIDVLHTLTAQMDIRDQILYSNKVSTWDRYGAPSTMIVVDDYSGALERMPNKRKSEVVSEVKSLAMDGAKFGLNLMIGLQKPTWENIDTTIRSQMGRIVYSVDVGDSRIALGEEGAERLPAQWNFLTRMTDDSSVQRGVGFVLQDVEIEAFLKSRPVAQNEQPDWIDATVVSESLPPTDGSAESIYHPVGMSSMPQADIQRENADKIVQLYLDFLNRHQKPVLAEIERAVFGKTGGSFHNNTKQAIATFEGVGVEELNQVIEEHVASWNTTTDSATTEKTAPSPDFQAV